jgi:hypothetical protein
MDVLKGEAGKRVASGGRHYLSADERRAALPGAGWFHGWFTSNIVHFGMWHALYYITGITDVLIQNIMRVIKKHEGERGLKGNGAAVCVGLGSALCQVVQGRCGGPSDLG